MSANTQKSHNVADETVKVSENTGLDPKTVKSEAEVKKTSGKRGNPFKGEAGPGRPKGVPNKTTGLLKDMIMQALNEAGGVNYLVTQAHDNPKAFLSLVSRVLPMQVTGESGGAISITFTQTDAKL